MTTAISVERLVKDFGSRPALDQLELTVAAGEVHGFLGPNGAGKTTTLRILLGLLAKDGGAVSVLGLDPWRDAAALHRRLAYVPGEVSLWPNLTGGEVIDLLGSLRGGLDRTRRAGLIERFQLDPTKKCRAYSKGNRQKVALVAAFAAGAELYLLDEPTSGLDPLMAAVFQDCVREANAAGATVLLSSHILSEVEALCGRLTIVRAGRTADSGTFEDLRHLTRTACFAGLSIAVAGRLALRRDMGAGFLPERAGHEHASVALRGPFGLAWRLQRPAFLGWLVALVGFGLIFGSVSESARHMGGSAQQMYQRMYGTGAMLDAWFTTLVVIGGIAVAIYTVQVLLRMREEEARGRLEAVLSGAVSRPRWMMSSVLTALAGGSALLLAYATAVALGSGTRRGAAGLWARRPSRPRRSALRRYQVRPTRRPRPGDDARSTRPWTTRTAACGGG